MSLNAKRNSSAKTRRLLKFESMESRRLLAADVFQINVEIAEDANSDNFVSPIDSRLLTNQLNASTTAASASPSNSASFAPGAVDQYFVEVNDESVGNDEHDRGEHHGSQNETSETEFISPLQGTGAQLGYVQFETELKHGTTKSQLGISVNSLTPNATLDVVVGGITVGQIKTDANGHGDLDLSSGPRESDELPLPANIPIIATGTTIQIGTELSGTFTNQTAMR